MPSPFPGMDPYLEHPTQWPNLHHRIITTISTVLNAGLPPQYVASIGERLYVVPSERGVYPDIVLVEQPLASLPPGESAGGTAVMVASDPPWVLTVLPEEIREGFVQIVTVGDESEIIAVIEVLSPTNKSSGTTGRELYLTKQREILQSRTHLIEVDLLRQGEHTVAPPVDYLLQHGYWDYLASLHRGGQGGRFEVWPNSLRQRLPRICVPLAEGEPDLTLDLQAVFARCYDEGALSRRLNYRQRAPIRLSREDAEWAEALLRERGLRE
jgi:uncharacterized protein DUF4058